MCPHFTAPKTAAAWLISSTLLLIAAWSLVFTHQMPLFVSRTPLDDLVKHVLFFSVISYIGYRLVWPNKTVQLWGWTVPVFPLGLGLLTALDEALQSPLPQRAFSMLDLLSSVGGVILGWQIAELGRRLDRAKLTQAQSIPTPIALPMGPALETATPDRSPSP
ncbi:MAG: hypothetical protein EA001_16405 [Oscillatoriales cyanobacterium]|nr:MAG: hypothetical protein EA001_16405 [Oscillatoriales cyanobacterium]